MANNVPFALTGIPANYQVPGIFLQINYAQGALGGNGETYSAVIYGNKSSAGTAGVDGYIYGPDTFTPLLSDQDAITLFGDGSELYRMYDAFVTRNPLTPVYVVPVKSSTGSAAQLEIVISGSPTSPGTIRTYFTAQQVVDTGFTTSDTPTTIAANMAVNINSNSHWPFTASASTGTVTLTANCPGLRGNDLQASAQLLNGSGVVSSVVTQTAFTGGTVSDNNTNALAYVAGLNRRFYVQVSASGTEDGGTQYEALASQISEQALPATGLRQLCIAASSASAGTVNSVANAVNNPRARLLNLPGSDMPPSEIASIMAAASMAVQVYPITAADCNLDGLGGDANSEALWDIPAPLNGDALSATLQNTLLTNGVSPIQVLKGGRTSLVKDVTTYSLNGSLQDFRIADAFKVIILDYFADDFVSGAGLQFARMLISNDPAPNQPDIPGVLSPRLMRTFASQLVTQYGNNGVLQNVPAILAGLVSQRGVVNTSQMQVILPMQTADATHSIGVIVNQIH